VRPAECHYWLEINSKVHTERCVGHFRRQKIVCGEQLWTWQAKTSCHLLRFSTLRRRNLKTKLFDIAYSKREHSVLSLPLCASDHLMTHGSI